MTSTTHTPSRRGAAAQRSARRRARGAGFTIIEVMVSMSIMVVGVLAVVALQQHTIRANVHARELSTGMQIAQLWIERFKQDAATWTDVGSATGVPSLTTVLANTLWLSRVNTAPDVYQTIPNTAVLERSNGFDFLGAPINMTSNAADAYYCVSFRPSWVYVGRSLRVDVRVWWARPANGNRSIAIDTPACVDDNVSLSPGGGLYGAFHTVYLSTVIRHTQT